MTLANGTSTIRTGPLTEHTRTAIHFCEYLTGVKFDINESPEHPHVIITCQGIGFK
jgi:RNA 3'-terminal phosphate cyclase (ATP)